MSGDETIKKIKRLAANIRKDIVLMVGDEGRAGHLGGSCSSADIIAVLFGYKMRYKPEDPNWEDRDKLIYSKGHAAIAQYAAMAEAGYFPKEELKTAKSLGSRLQGHPDKIKLPGIEAGTGSLGQGLSIANGMALAMRLDGKDNKVYCILGDGELAEGQIWEAAMAASNFKIGNIIAILDHNKLQSTGALVDRFDIRPIEEKWKGFGWATIEIDGHDIEEIISAVDEADRIGREENKPVIIIANTVKGKGISFAENVVGFHNGALTPEQYKQAMEELDAALAELN